MTNNQIVGSIKPSKIIDTVFGGRKNTIVKIWNMIKKYPKLFQWLFLLACIFWLYVLQLMFQKLINL